MSVGPKLKKIRNAHDLTQEQFADKIDVKRTTYVSYENSKTIPPTDVLKKVSDVFRVPMDYLLNDDEPEESRFWLEFKAPEVEYNPGVKREQKILSGDEDMIIDYYRLLEKDKKSEFFEKIKNDYLDIICGVDNE